MSTVRVALLQMLGCGPDVAANLAKGDAFCRRARAMGADIALFPEMWSVGYTFFERGNDEQRAAWAARAIGPDDPYLVHFRGLARELQMAIAVTYLERWEGRPRNTVAILDRRGETALTYAKVHTCEFDVEAALTPGDGFPVCTLDTAQGPVKVGCMICYDREFPESARILMLNGAELILTPNACGLRGLRLAQFQVRAYENMVGVAIANYAAPQDDGHSCAFDGIAYPIEDGRERDMLVVQAGDGEGVFVADFDLGRLRAYREHEAWGDAYRRPRLYGRLTDGAVQPPFVRPDATR